MYYKDAITRETPIGQIRVQKYLDSLEYVKNEMVRHHTYEYDEDIWTKRLSTGMKFRYMNLNVDYKG